jgi:hypothetical protein
MPPGSSLLLHPHLPLLQGAQTPLAGWLHLQLLLLLLSTW